MLCARRIGAVHISLNRSLSEILDDDNHFSRSHLMGSELQ